MDIRSAAVHRPPLSVWLGPVAVQPPLAEDCPLRSQFPESFLAVVGSLKGESLIRTTIKHTRNRLDRLNGWVVGTSNKHNFALDLPCKSGPLCELHV